MDATEIIDRLGGVTEVATALGANPNTVTYWCRRGSIPSIWWVDLVQVARTKCAPVTLEVLASHRSARAAV
jgi:hypothetical protein